MRAAQQDQDCRYARSVQGQLLLRMTQAASAELMPPSLSQLGREVLDIAAAMLKPGVTTLEIDAVVHEECLKRNSYPSPLNYNMFPRSVCT